MTTLLRSCFVKSAIFGLAMLAFAGASALADDDSKGPPALATEGPKPKPIEPPTPEEVEASIQRGVEWLIENQNPNGSWGSARRTKQLNIMAPVPGAHHAYQGGTTSLCISALIDLNVDDPQAVEALDKAEAWLLDRAPHFRRSEQVCIYNNWAHAYSIQAFCRMLKRHADDEAMAKEIRSQIEHQIDMLRRYECVDGGWCYYDFDYHTQRPAGSTISFVTATVLVALAEARDAGIEVPQRLVDRGMASILRQRKNDFAYLYGEYLKMQPSRGINRPAGSLGRSQACNIAMRRWGDEKVTDEVLTNWLDRLFARNGWLVIGAKRPVPHEAWFQIAGYFYYYGHYYAALCIEDLPAELQPTYQDYMAATMIREQEKNGSWFDYPLYDYGHSYATGYALQTMARCRKAQ